MKRGNPSGLRRHRRRIEAFQTWISTASSLNPGRLIHSFTSTPARRRLETLDSLVLSQEHPGPYHLPDLGGPWINQQGPHHHHHHHHFHCTLLRPQKHARLDAKISGLLILLYLLLKLLRGGSTFGTCSKFHPPSCTPVASSICLKYPLALADLHSPFPPTTTNTIIIIYHRHDDFDLPQGHRGARCRNANGHPGEAAPEGEGSSSCITTRRADRPTKDHGHQTERVPGTFVVLFGNCWIRFGSPRSNAMPQGCWKC